MHDRMGAIRACRAVGTDGRALARDRISLIHHHPMVARHELRAVR
jgi:hypothetical protein